MRIILRKLKYYYILYTVINIYYNCYKNVK